MYTKIDICYIPICVLTKIEVSLLSTIQTYILKLPHHCNVADLYQYLACLEMTFAPKNMTSRSSIMWKYRTFSMWWSIRLYHVSLLVFCCMAYIDTEIHKQLDMDSNMYNIVEHHTEVLFCTYRLISHISVGMLHLFIYHEYWHLQYLMKS